MSSLVTTRRGVTATTAVAIALALVSSPLAGADPDETQPIPVAPDVVAAAVDPVGQDGAGRACQQFAEALDLAAGTYSDFADVTSGDQWRYDDPVVRDANVTGRTALRMAAARALDASATPGVQPEIAGPMRKWSLQASKLLVLMGLRSGDDRINTAAVALNDDTYSVQLACAQNQSAATG
ncbi:hypothetical protein [Mycolicibacterium sp. 624]|uniref:hypothetical protein n=1 Tax=Mycolicibacterium sp. 624 TaxID=3156314 RepID=UPI0033974804